ncbi:MAG: hypothetical protein P1V97_38270, partial [Planctomycetota bacterium]|nr:hypothetical protein [Planctomycetota bacterium]
MKLANKCFPILLVLCISHNVWAQEPDKVPPKVEDKDKAAGEEDRAKTPALPGKTEKKVILPVKIKQDRFARESEVDGRLRALERRTKVQQKTIEDLQKELAETKENAAKGDALSTEDSDYSLEDVSDDLEELRGRLDDLVSISGYYDFEYSDATRGSRESFRQHHVSIFLSRKLGEFRFFTEIEFEDATNIKGNGDGTFNESDGEVKVETAWGQWEPKDWFKVRAGFFLIPHWYHINHFPYLTNTTLRPNFIRRIVPFQTNGVMIHGTYFFENSGTENLSDFGLTYYAYVGNGRTSNPGKGDDDHNKNLGGRVVFHLPRPDWIRKLNLGFGTYIEDDSSKARDEYER